MTLRLYRYKVLQNKEWKLVVGNKLGTILWNLIYEEINLSQILNVKHNWIITGSLGTVWNYQTSLSFWSSVRSLR